MSDFFIYAFSTAVVYFFSLVGIEYAYSKSRKVRLFLVCTIITAFSLFNGWVINVNKNRIPISSVEKAWNEYTTYCKEEHISWNELTFPDWLALTDAE